MSNHDGNPFAGCTAPPPTTATITALRRDGKLAVSFHFPISGRTIRKVLTPAQVHELRGYVVSWPIGFKPIDKGRV